MSAMPTGLPLMPGHGAGLPHPVGFSVIVVGLAFSPALTLHTTAVIDPVPEQEAASAD
jgi:hypothetical protein